MGPTRLVTGTIAGVAIATLALAQSVDDMDLFAKIRAEGTDRSQVEPVFDMFTVQIGPRLPGTRRRRRLSWRPFKRR